MPSPPPVQADGQREGSRAGKGQPTGNPTGPWNCPDSTAKRRPRFAVPVLCQWPIGGEGASLEWTMHCGRRTQGQPKPIGDEGFRACGRVHLCWQRSPAYTTPFPRSVYRGDRSASEYSTCSIDYRECGPSGHRRFATDFCPRCGRAQNRKVAGAKDFGYLPARMSGISPTRLRAARTPSAVRVPRRWRG